MLGELLRPEIEELIAARDFQGLREAFDKMEPVDVADVIDDLPVQEQVVLFRVLPREDAARVFEYLDRPHQEELIKNLSGAAARQILDEMSPDDRTALLAELPAEVTRTLLQILSPEELQVARQLLGYPENSVGRLMTPDYVALSPDLTSAQALEEIRRIGRGKETLINIFLIDAAGHLVGDVELGEIVLSDPQVMLRDLVVHQLAPVPATADQEEALELARRYDRTTLPAVDTLGKLIGIVTVDDLLDVAEEEATEDIQKMGAVQALENPYFGTDHWTMFRKRVVWLTSLFVGGMLTAHAMERYGRSEAALHLLIFLPLVLSAGGNSGSQSASLVIRGLAVGEMALADWWKVFLREVLMGHVLGLALGLVGFLRALLGGQTVMEATALGATLVGVVTCGTFVGSMMPFALRRAGLDPAVSSSPFIASFVDVTGIVLFFSVASLVLRWAGM